MPEDNKLSDSDGAVLVKTARKAVTEFLSNGNKIKLEPEFEKKFSFNSGVFVTLNNTGGLRGCIGFPMPVKNCHAQSWMVLLLPPLKIQDFLL